MERRDLLAGAFAAGVSLALAGAAFAQPPQEEHRVSARGYNLLIRVQRGSKPSLPTIVLESGGGFDSTQWASLQPTLAADTGATVVSYDRPGYGQSELPAKPYDIADELAAFHEALETLGLAQRVLLVGHSYGGFLVQLYANRWAPSVKGILFLDPNTPTAMLAMSSEGRPAPITDPKTPRQRANARADVGFEDALSTVYRSPLPLQIPVIVVSAETPPFASPRLAKVFKLSHQLLAASVNDGKTVTAERSNHLIPAQRPDLVTACVQELLAKAG